MLRKKLDALHWRRHSVRIVDADVQVHGKPWRRKYVWRWYGRYDWEGREFGSLDIALDKRWEKRGCRHLRQAVGQAVGQADAAEIDIYVNPKAPHRSVILPPEAHPILPVLAGRITVIVAFTVMVLGVL